MTCGRTLTRSLLACTLLGAVACADVAPPSAPDAVPVQPTTPLAPAPGAIGTFVRTGYAVTGSVTLVIRNDTAQLDFSADFNIASTPGPFVYLNTTSNVNQGAPLRIGALRARSGAQRYTFLVPPGVRYTKVIIWCDPFNVGMAEATLP